MSLWKCPLCGKQNSMRKYEPYNFEDDITVILMRGLGKGKGFEVVDEYSLLDGSDPELLDLISDRVEVVYDFLFEDVEEDRADELVDEINSVLGLDDSDGAFDNLNDATEALLAHFRDYEEDDILEDDSEEEDTDEEKDAFEFDDELIE